MKSLDLRFWPRLFLLEADRLFECTSCFEMAWLSSRLGLTTRRPKPMEFNRNPESAKTLRAHIPLLVGLVAPRHPP